MSSRPSSFARPGRAMAAAAIGAALALFVAAGYPLWRPLLWALPEALIVAIDVAVVLLPLAGAVIVGVASASPRGARRTALGLSDARAIYIVLGVAAGLVMRAVVELFWPSAGGLAGSFSPDAAPAMAVAVVGAVVLAPTVEELFFRGLLQRALLQAMTGDASTRTPAAGIAAIAITTAVFSLLHLLPAGATVSWGLVAGTVVTGVGCGLVAFVARSTWPAVAAHVTFNAAGVVALLAL